MTQEEFENSIKLYKDNTPYDKESLYYREIFEKYYPNKSNTIPYYWKHPFTTEQDPSARLLKCYTDDKEEVQEEEVQKKEVQEEEFQEEVEEIEVQEVEVQEVEDQEKEV